MENEPDLAALLELLGADGQALAFSPWENEQNVLSQEMALAEQLRQRGPERSSPTGALLGGLSNALGNVGGAFMQRKNLDRQMEIGQEQQRDALGRTGAFAELLRKKKGVGPGGLMPTMSDDALMALFSGGGP